MNNGYARNYLFPKKLAVEATKENLSKLDSKNEANKFKKQNEKNEAEEIAKQLKEITLTDKGKSRRKRKNIWRSTFQRKYEKLEDIK